MDRLFRNVIDCLQTVDSWDAKRTELHIIDFGGSSVNTSTATGRMMLTLLATLAEWERGIISERTVAVLDLKKDKGESLGRPKYGLKASEEGVHYEAADDERRAIRFILGARAHGESYRAIARGLEEAGIPSRSGKWHPGQVQRIAERRDFYAEMGIVEPAA